MKGALAEAPVRLDATYTTACIAHVPLETRAALAEWEGDRLTVWTGTQRPFGVRAELAEEIGVPEENVRVVAPTAGSAFGGKHRGEVAIEAARLARDAGRPVKVHWSRADEFEAAYVRPAAVIDVHSGADSDGTGDRLGLPEHRLRRRGNRLPVRDCAPAARLSARRLAPACRARTAASEPPPTTSPASLTSTSSPHRLGVDPVELRLRHLDDERLAGRPPRRGRTRGLERRDLGWESRAASRRAPTSRPAPKSASSRTERSASRGSSRPSTAARSSTPTTS